TGVRRNYAPERDVKLLHLALDVTPDFKQRTIQGKATLTFKPIGKMVTELRLDAVELNVHAVTTTAKLQAYQVADDLLTLTFAEPLASGKEVSVTITYD